MRMPPRYRYITLSASAAIALTLATLTPLSAVHAQDTPPPGPAQGAPTKTINFTLNFSRPGSYQYYPLVQGLSGERTTVPAGESSVTVEMPDNADGIVVVDDVTGLVTSVPRQKIKSGRKITIKPDQFNQIQAVIIHLNSKNGEPAAKGVIRLTYAGAEPLQYGLRTMDGGSARFDNIPLGKAEVAAYANTGDDVVKQTVNVVPTKGGAPLEVTITLPIDVQTIKPSEGAASPTANGAPNTAPAAPTIIVNTGEKQAPPKNDWVSGLVGLAILGGGIFFGLRYLKQKGMTVKDLLQQAGVDSPGASIPGSPHAGLRPSDPVVSQAPPLPSLADLPVANTAKGPVSTVAGAGFTGPRLIGLSGPAAGNTYALRSDTETMLSVGRDPKSTIPFPSDSAISRRHAVFLANGAGWDVMDEGSTNGTFLNGRKLDGRSALSPGDEIQIGTSRFRFEA